MEQSSGIEALGRAVEIFKTQVAFARAIGVPQSRVSEVLKGEGRGIPAEWCPKIEEATQGRVVRSELRPDLWPDREEAAQ
jgi:DNA-binding transcriptional regulator YdaS (Cro superfamily)